jgi:hypothetical protein
LYLLEYNHDLTNLWNVCYRFITQCREALTISDPL